MPANIGDASDVPALIAIRPENPCEHG